MIDWSKTHVCQGNKFAYWLLDRAMNYSEECRNIHRTKSEGDYFQFGRRILVVNTYDYPEVEVYATQFEADLRFKAIERY